MKVQGSGLKIVHPNATKVAMVIERETLEKAKRLVSKVSLECQWWHQLDRYTGDNGTVYYYIYDIVVPKQEVSAAAVESSPEEMIGLFQLLAEERGGMKEASEVLQKLTVWCHSHVNMGVSPSGTDNKTFKEFVEQDVTDGLSRVQAMMIFNKKDDVFTRLYDPEFNLVFENVPLIIQDDIDFTEVDSWVKERIVKKVYKPTTGRRRDLLGKGTALNRPSYPSKKNSQWTPTDDSYFDEFEFYGSGNSLVDQFGNDIISLVKKCNSGNNFECTFDLAELVAKQLTPEEILILNLLLSNDEEEIRLIENCDFEPDELDAKEILGLINIVESTTIEPPELFLEAVNLSVKLTGCNQPEAREVLLDSWISTWLGEEVKNDSIVS